MNEHGARPAIFPNFQISLWRVTEPSLWYSPATQTSLQSHSTVETSLWLCLIVEHSLWPHPAREPNESTKLQNITCKPFHKEAWRTTPSECRTKSLAHQLYYVVGKPFQLKNQEENFAQQQSIASSLFDQKAQPTALPYYTEQSAFLPDLKPQPEVLPNHEALPVALSEHIIQTCDLGQLQIIGSSAQGTV